MFYLIKNLFNQKRGGMIPDLPDARDLKLEEIMGAPESQPLPKEFKLDYDFRIKDQGKTWSCVGQTAAAHKQFQERMDLSARWAYNKCKEIDGYPKKGTYIRIGAKICADFGICEEIYAPEAETSSEAKFRAFTATPEMITNAEKHKSKRYFRIDGDWNSAEYIKQAIHKYRQPVIMGGPWYGNYYIDSRGYLPLPKGPMKFGHAFLCIGWDKNGYLLCINSWGKKWGKDGMFYFNPEAPKYDCWITLDMDEIEIPEKPQKRDIELEKEKALLMRQAIEATFAKYDKARHVAGTEWFIIINALTYLGYSFIDIQNYCYAKSRDKKIPFDLTKKRENMV